MTRPRADLPDAFLLTLEVGVPFRMVELDGRPQADLIRLADAAATAVGCNGDDLQYGGEHTAAAMAALITGLASAALLAENGITAWGLHWCARPHPDCPSRIASRPLADKDDP